MLSRDIETNPGALGKLSYKVCEKIVRSNSKHLSCKVCKNLQHRKCCKDQRSKLHKFNMSRMYTLCNAILLL